MAVFDGVCYSLSPTLPPSRRTELAAVLDLNGAVPQPPYTHLIVLAASHAHSDVTNKPNLKIVTDRWVDRSVVLGKLQPEQYYSPDPAMIFSGVVACATDLSAPDLEVLSAGITALGGQWRIGLTRDVTHLFALRTGSDKYNTALHFAPQTHMCIITPHWFDDSVRLGRRVPETPYTWPDPLILRPGVTLDPDDDVVTMEGRRKKLQGDTEADNTTNIPNEGEHVRVWDSRRILLSASLELGSRSRSAIEAGIRRAGGVVVPIAEDADEHVEAMAIDECDIFVTRWRSGKPYFKAARASLLIGTLTWLFSVESSGTLHSPLDSLLWYPVPRGGVPGLIDCEISVTNYTGAARDYLKRLIVLVGAKFTPNMSQSNKVLVAGFQPSPKTTRALSWSIPVVNHTWLEDCFVEWRALTVGLERYIVYPTGIDFGKMLMTRHAPSSQPAPLPRSSGGAVPGGRGVGTINVEQEEIRDAEYRARVPEDGPSTSPVEGTGPRSQTAAVRKTPSSSARRRGSVSTPRTSATTAFVDHVIELPADDDAGGRRTPANGKRREQTPLGSRTSPRSVSRASSGLFSNGADIEVEPPTGGSAKGKAKGREERKSDTGKRRTRPADEEEEDIFGASRNSKSRSAQQKSDVRGAQTDDEVEKRAPGQASKPKRRIANKAIDSDVEVSSDGGADDGLERGSVPPRRAVATGSSTPVKSGMKPRPKSKSASKPRSAPGGESEDEVRKLAAESGTFMETQKGKEPTKKPTRNGEVGTKEKKKAKGSEGKKETGPSTSSPRSPTRSPLATSPKTTNARLLKRRLSVVVPSVPKDYFSSQPSVHDANETHDKGERVREKDPGASAGSTSRGKRVAPAASICAVSAEASTSKAKRAKPLPAKSTGVSRKSDPKLQAKSKSKAGGSKGAVRVRASEDEEMDDVEEGDGTSMIVESVASSSRGGPRRSAANKASTRLREEIMPDVVSFEKERKQAKRRRSEDWASVVSVREEAEDAPRQEKSGKRRKVSKEEEEEEEEVAVSTKPKARVSTGKGKEKENAAVDSDEEVEVSPIKGKPGRKKGSGRGKESTAIRLMTTGVSLSDDVVKRLTKLGIQMTTKPTDCTHLIAKGVVRTEKFLCAMSVSPYVLTEEWANASAKGGKPLPESNYLLSDEAAEKKWSFKFTDALARAKEPEGGPNLFNRMTFYVTPKVAVDAKLLKNVVSAGGGQVQTSTTPTVRILNGKADRYVVSCEEDRGIWRPLAQEGFKVYSAELLLRGALRQEIEWENKACLVAG